MASSGSFLTQVSPKQAWKSTSNRWSSGKNRNGGMSLEAGLNQLCGGDGNNSTAARKRVMVVVDHSSDSKHALIWALTHAANKADLLTLLHVVPPHMPSHSSYSAYLFNYLRSLCKDSKPEMEVEELAVEGPKLSTVTSQVKKLEVSVLVLGQKKPSLLFNCLCGNSEEDEFVEHCINNAECLTIGVRKRSQGTNGYLISTKWQKNFWLLA